MEFLQRNGNADSCDKQTVPELCFHLKLFCYLQKVSLTFSELNPLFSIAVNSNATFFSENNPFQKWNDPLRTCRFCSRKQCPWNEDLKVRSVQSWYTGVFLLLLLPLWVFAHVFSSWLYIVLRHFLWADTDYMRLQLQSRCFPKRK